MNCSFFPIVTQIINPLVHRLLITPACAPKMLMMELASAMMMVTISGFIGVTILSSPMENYVFVKVAGRLSKLYADRGDASPYLVQ